MMKKYLIFIIFSFLLYSCASTKNRENEHYLYGKYTWIDWQKSAQWSDYTASEYQTSEFLISQIKEVSKTRKYELLLFLGNWCGDSKTEVPKIMKIIEQAELDLARLELWGVDRDKTEPSGFAVKNDIEKIPTLVILTDGKEIGRIVEFPKATWEQDILNILIK